MAQLPIPFSSPTLGSAEADAVQATVASGFIGSGKLVRQLEAQVAQFAERRFGIATLSGSAALVLALKVMQIHDGDEVVVPAFACRAVLNAVLEVGATPVFVDLDPFDLTPSAEAARRALTTQTKAVVLTHLFGATAALDEFLRLPVPIIEDGASSMGATFRGRPAGGFGVVSIYSFGSTKMMTTGKGGMLLTDDMRLAQRAHDLIDYDRPLATATSLEEYPVGMNEGLTDLQASLGLVQLGRMEEFVARRREIALCYNQALDLPGWQLPSARAESVHSYYRYVIQIQEHAADIARRLQSQGIDARTSVSHLLYDYLNISRQQFPNCECVRNKILALPIYPTLTDSQVEFIVDACRAAQKNES